jgi:hypothetical protein
MESHDFAMCQQKGTIKHDFFNYQTCVVGGEYFQKLPLCRVQEKSHRKVITLSCAKKHTANKVLICHMLFLYRVCWGSEIDSGYSTLM